MSDPPSPLSTLVILLGASEWPNFPEFRQSEAFSNSARGFSDYLLDTEAFSLPQENLLDLFDADQSPDDIDQAIGCFLEKRIIEMKETNHAARDVLFYFVGHGGFSGNNFDYYLAIRRTRVGNPAASSVRIETLAHTMRERARYLRRMVILDCCFSASAAQFFQNSDPAQVAIKQTVDAFRVPGKGVGLPGRGTSLLCSSRHNVPSLISPDESYTMFTQALLHVLRKGDSRRQEDWLSLRMVADLAAKFLDTTYREASRPEVHSPDQSEGDVADVPFFPNLPQTKVEEAENHNSLSKLIKESSNTYMLDTVNGLAQNTPNPQVQDTSVVISSSSKAQIETEIAERRARIQAFEEFLAGGDLRTVAARDLISFSEDLGKFIRQVREMSGGDPSRQFKLSDRALDSLYEACTYLDLASDQLGRKGRTQKFYRNINLSQKSLESALRHWGRDMKK